METDESMLAEYPTDPRIALVAGASGMVGTELCNQLRRDRRFAPVVVLARSKPPITEPPLQIEIVDFSKTRRMEPERATRHRVLRARDHHQEGRQRSGLSRRRPRPGARDGQARTARQCASLHLRQQPRRRPAVRASSTCGSRARRKRRSRRSACRMRWRCGRRSWTATGRAPARREGGPGRRPGAEAAAARAAGKYRPTPAPRWPRPCATSRSPAAKASRFSIRWPSCAGRKRTSPAVLKGTTAQDAAPRRRVLAQEALDAIASRTPRIPCGPARLLSASDEEIGLGEQCRANRCGTGAARRPRSPAPRCAGSPRLRMRRARRYRRGDTSR